MIYGVYLSGSSSFKPLKVSGLPGIRRGSRVVLDVDGERRIGYVVSEEGGRSRGRILSVLDTFLCDGRFDLSLWISDRYMNPPGRVLDLHYPSGLDDYVVEIVESTSGMLDFEQIAKSEFVERYGERVLNSYIERGLVRISYRLRLPNPAPDPESVVRIPDLKTIFARDLTPEELEIIRYLMVEGTVRYRDLKHFSKKALNSLIKKGLIEFGPDEKKVVSLTPEQEEVIEGLSDSSSLILGPTGSGKTEVYLSIMEGKRTLYLVPEASLVPQTLRRIRSRFPNLVVEAYHSYLSKARRVSNWISTTLGNVNVLVGTRSALFVPARWDLVIVDEDHDSSYYQREGVVYDAVEVARELARILRARVVFGSATPNLTNYHRALSGEIKLLRLKKTLGSRKVIRVDLKREKRRGSFAEITLDMMRKTLESGKGVMVYVRRRGFGRVVCERCNLVLKCQNCDVPLVYHSDESKFRCHVCGFEVEAFDTCPRCGGILRVVGRGTERVESELKRYFPNLRIARADRDVLKRPDAVMELLDALSKGKIDVLVGTRMISKGIDVPNVGLMVVTDMDGMLSIPDFSTTYKLFIELVQAIGRVGRTGEGTAIVQYHSVDEELLDLMEREDVEGFYEYELRRREEFSYPPFVHIVHVLKASSSSDMARDSIDYVARELRSLGEEVLGPSRHPVFKVKGVYRYQILVKTKEVEKTVSRLREILARVGRKGWRVFVDPPELYLY